MESSAPRLVVLVIGQLRSADRTMDAFRAHLACDEDVEVRVQCGAGEAAAAARLFPGAMVDAWDPPPCPWQVRWAWPFLGQQGREAAPMKVSFFAQLMRQQRAAKRLIGGINPARDWILKWRPDLLLLDRLEWRACLRSPAVWLPPYDNFGGLNDQWALGPAERMLQYLSRVSLLGDYFAVGGRIQAEAFLRWALEGGPVERLSTPYCLHRGDRMHSVTNSRSFGDLASAELLDQVRRAGVPVLEAELGPAYGAAAFPRCGRYGQLWQRMLAHSFRVAGLGRVIGARQ